MKYFLVFDTKKHDERYQKIDLDLHDLPSICKFTGNFNDEKELIESLYQKGLCSSLDKNNHIVICYLHNGYWRTCGKSQTFDHQVLFSDSASLIYPDKMIKFLTTLGIKERLDYKYENATEKEKYNLELLIKILNFLLDPYFEYSYIKDDIHKIFYYIERAKKNNTIEPNYYALVQNLVDHLIYTYDKYDYNRTNPKLNKNGNPITNYRNLFELALYIENAKLQLNQKYTKQKEILSNQKPSSPFNDEEGFEQLSLY